MKSVSDTSAVEFYPSKVGLPLPPFHLCCPVPVPAGNGGAGALQPAGHLQGGVPAGAGEAGGRGTAGRKMAGAGRDCQELALQDLLHQGAGAQVGAPA